MAIVRRRRVVPSLPGSRKHNLEAAGCPKSPRVENSEPHRRGLCARSWRRKVWHTGTTWVDL
eukprot:1899403-Lingulodinium_polyedra.AAC.1